MSIFRDGFHRAYTELFNLVENRRKARIAAGPGSHLSLEIKLENENNYLDKLKDNLCSGTMVKHLFMVKKNFLRSLERDTCTQSS